MFFRSRIKIPGKYYELNIHYGVLVGGMGDFNELFLGNQENFRGCLDDVVFNGVDVYDKARVRETFVFPESSLSFEKPRCLGMRPRFIQLMF